MTDIEYKGRKYEFSWYSVILFFILCPICALLTYFIFSYFWIYTYPPFIYPASILLNLLTGSDFSYYMSGNRYLISVPGLPDISFVSACTGIHAYAIYLGICIATPRNKLKKENRNTWLRRGLTFIIPSILVYFINILRMVLAVIVYYNGVPFNPFHEYLGYFTTFFAVFVFYFISYFWLPEFSLFVIWIKEQVKILLIKRKTSKIKLEVIPEAVGNSKKTRKTFILSTWIVICIVLVIIFSILVV